MELKTYQQKIKIAIKIINLLSDEEVSIYDIDSIFDESKRIIMLETKIKKIED